VIRLLFNFKNQSAGRRAGFKNQFQKSISKINLKNQFQKSILKSNLKNQPACLSVSKSNFPRYCERQARPHKKVK